MHAGLDFFVMGIGLLVFFTGESNMPTLMFLALHRK
jgi:hypothetical protein